MDVLQLNYVLLLIVFLCRINYCVDLQNRCPSMKFAKESWRRQELVCYHSYNPLIHPIISSNFSGGKDHALFQPSGHEADPGMGKWLRADRTLEYYDLKQNVCT